jgi:hypothetical protein
VYIDAVDDTDSDHLAPAEGDIELATGQHLPVDPADGSEADTDPVAYVVREAPASARAPSGPRAPRSTALIVLVTATVTAVVVVGLAFLIVAIRGGGGPATDPFSGTWVSVDRDGSGQELTFTGEGLVREVTLRDDRSRRCGEVPSVATGRGQILGTGRFTAFLRFRCSNGHSVQPVRVLWVADGGREVLTESNGVVWRRRGR